MLSIGLESNACGRNVSAAAIGLARDDDRIADLARKILPILPAACASSSVNPTSERSASQNRDD